MGNIGTEMTLREAMDILIAMKHEDATLKRQKDVFKLMSFINAQHEYQTQNSVLQKENERLRLVVERGQIGWVDDCTQLLDRTDDLEKEVRSSPESVAIMQSGFENRINAVRRCITYGCMPSPVCQVLDRSFCLKDELDADDWD